MQSLLTSACGAGGISLVFDTVTYTGSCETTTITTVAATTTTPTAITSAATATTLDTSYTSEFTNATEPAFLYDSTVTTSSSSSPLVAGIAAGVGAGFLLILVVIVILIRRQRKSKSASISQVPGDQTDLSRDHESPHSTSDSPEASTQMTWDSLTSESKASSTQLDSRRESQATLTPMLVDSLWPLRASLTQRSSDSPSQIPPTAVIRARTQVPKSTVAQMDLPSESSQALSPLVMDSLWPLRAMVPWTQSCEGSVVIQQPGRSHTESPLPTGTVAESQTLHSPPLELESEVLTPLMDSLWPPRSALAQGSTQLKHTALSARESQI